MKHSTKLMIIIFLFFLSISIYGAISAAERAALIALYKATNGNNWTDNSGWKGNNNEPDGFSKIGSEGTWFGIKLSSSGNYVSYINLDNNQLSGTIPSELENITYLDGLYLDDNHLTGTIPPELGNITEIRGITLENNQLTGSIPPELAKCTDLQNLTLGYNQLNGGIPAGLGSLQSLRYLRLYYNQLSGSIPPELGSLSNLQYLELQGNELTGSIPPELGNLSNLKNLYLQINQLSGTIPPELAKLSQIYRIIVSYNKLEGNLPAELGDLSSLGYLSARSNKLTGNLPTSLTKLTGIVTISINYNGLYTSDNNLLTFLNSKAGNWEDTQTVPPTNISLTPLSPTSVRVTWTPIIYDGDSGGYRIYFSTTGGRPWTESGILTSNKAVSSADVTGLNSGTTYYFSMKTRTNTHTENQNNKILSDRSSVVSATTSSMVEANPPFGSFATPLDGSTVAGSISITGWALDDSGIDHIKIYRASGKNLLFIGDAIRVEGARPDVAAAYPGYPNNTKAGWGYMMLTNFLPNGGNGTFVLHAIATDVVGKSTTLGTKTIHCDNAHAVKPFGAIDTPIQGGTASGNRYVNWGWALTPQPNSIPTDGSTIDVWVDGVNLGHPTFNLSRTDIENLFPGYANSNGAVGYFFLDTTKYSDGVHTIQWTARDTGGNTDGIGSRYFTIQNAGSDTKASMLNAECLMLNRDWSRIPVDDTLIHVKKGFEEKDMERVVEADESGEFRIKIRELEPLRIKLPEKSTIIGCYQTNGYQIKRKPVGLSIKNNAINWMPGVAYLGNFRLIIVTKDHSGQLSKIGITVTILPKSSLEK